MAEETAVSDPSTTGLNELAASMRQAGEEYIGLVREVMGQHVKGLTFFGAVVGDSFEPARQTARNVVVLDRVELSVLRSLSEHGAKLGKAAISAPLVMTPEYIKASLDTFPLELIDIHQRHATVLGAEHFDDLSFEDSHVRLQCEREFKVALISLRQGVLAAAGKDKILAGVELDIGEGLMRTLRGLLWLKGKKTATPAGGVIAEVETLAKRPLPGIRASIDLGSDHGWSQLESLYNDVAALQEIADAW